MPSGIPQVAENGFGFGRREFDVRHVNSIFPQPAGSRAPSKLLLPKNFFANYETANQSFFANYEVAQLEPTISTAKPRTTC
jgi:hypothetical protein